MTMHYHGTPITPRSVLHTLAGACFCVSYADPRDVELCHQIGQSVMLDNGAFSMWTIGKETDWSGFYRWAETWLDWPTTWAVPPDVIAGTAEENDALLAKWPFPRHKGYPVWHLHEPIDRLLRLLDEWPRVCMGGSEQYKDIGSEAWHRRMDQAWNLIHSRRPWIHMLRGMACLQMGYPFASVDSADVGRHHSQRRDSAKAMVDHWDSIQAAGIWVPRLQGELFHD